MAIQPLVMRANTWDKIIGMDNQESYQDELPSLPIFPKDIVNNATRNYENITNKVAGTPASSTGKGKKKVIIPAIPAKYENVIDETSLGSFANPIIDRKEDPTTGIFGEVRNVQRADGQWIQLTPQEYDTIAKQYTDKNLNAGAVARLPVSFDPFQPVEAIDPNSQAGINQTQRDAQKNAQATLNSTTLDDYDKQTIQNIKIGQAAYPPGTSGTYYTADKVGYDKSITAYNAQQQAKMDAYEKVKAQIEAKNAETNYLNAEKSGLVPGTTNYKSDAYREQFGNTYRNESGDDSLPLPRSDVPAPPMPDAPPEMKMNSNSYAARPTFAPQLSGRDPKEKIIPLPFAGRTQIESQSSAKGQWTQYGLLGGMLSVTYNPTQVEAINNQAASAAVNNHAKELYSTDRKFNYFDGSQVKTRVMKATDAIDSFALKLGETYTITSKNNKIRDRFVYKKDGLVHYNPEFVFEKNDDGTIHKEMNEKGVLVPVIDPDRQLIAAKIMSLATSAIIKGIDNYVTQLSPNDMKVFSNLISKTYDGNTESDKIDAIVGYIGTNYTAKIFARSPLFRNATTKD